MMTNDDTGYGFSWMPPSTLAELTAEGRRIHDLHGLTRADVAGLVEGADDDRDTH
jgi:hypothetical protein